MTANLTLTYGSLNLTATPYLVEFGLDMGAPQNESNPLAFLLQDGEIELSSRASNRTFTFNVLIEGATLSVLATAEAALVAETEKVLNTLTVDPGDGAPATVYDIYRGQVSLVRDDNWELNRMRRYTVTVRALPFGKSTAEVVSVGLPTTGATTTTLDTMGATTGWTGTVNGVGGTIVNAVGPPTTNAISSASGTGSFTLKMQKTFAATTTTTKLLVVDWKSAQPYATPGITATGDGVALGVVAEQASPTSGYTRTYFYVAAASLAVTSFQIVVGVFATPAVATLTIDNVAVTNAPPTTGTARQQMRSLTLAGSATAQGRLKIESTTAALGNGTLVYTFPAAGANGYTPAMRQYRTAGNTVTSDSTMVSGSREPTTVGGVTFQIPWNLLPQGSYLLLARMAIASGTETGNVAISSSSSLSTNLGLVTTAARLTVGTTYETFALCRLSLPVVDVPTQTTSGVVINLSTNSGGWTNNPVLDEAWLFNTTIGQLIWVDCGTGAGTVGGPARRLFVDPATTLTPRPMLTMGHSADGSDAFYPSTAVGKVRAWQPPRYAPPQVNVFFVTPNVTDAAASLSYYPRWHTNSAS